MQKRQRGGSVKIPVTLSALAAIGIILGKFLAFNVTEFMRFSLENITIIFVGIVFGPTLGAVVGTVQDLVGCIAVGYAINPLITLGCASAGAISGIVFSSTKRCDYRIRISLSVLSSHLVGSVLIKSLGLSVFYSLPFGITVAWRLLNYAIVGAVEIVLLCILLKSKQLLTQINKITPFSLGVKFKSTSEISEYAKGISGVFSKPGLERVVALCEALGSPQKKVKVIHVTGTNGKGSTSAFLCSILRSAGLRVGAFNSPYLIEMREAIRIDGDEISEERLSELFDRIRPIADSLTDKPTEFELLTAAAYLAFSEAKVDVAVVECGMGARRDATNVIDSPLLSIITGVSVDHTAYLGSTLSDIAKEKTGVIKRGCPVLVGDTDPSCMNIIKEEASRLSSHVLYPDTPSVKELSQNGTLIDCGHLKNIKISLLGIHQPKNASLAIAAAKYLRERFPTLTDEAIRQGISDTVWKGRFEILGNAPTFIFDGAHNLEGIKSAVASIRAYFGKVVCLTGVLKDKEYVAMADEIATVANTVVTVTPNNPRALSADEYAKVFAARGTPSYPESSVQSATNTAISLSREGNIPVVCLGSLYLYKDVVNALKNIKNDK